LCAHWDHEQGRGNSGAAVPAVVAGVSPATNPGARRPGGRRDACPTRRSMEKSKEEVVVREPKQRKHDAHERNHMKKITLFALLGTGLLISGCFPTSINPLYTEQDLAFDPALAGVWHGGDGDAAAAKERWAFEKAGDKNYKLTYTDKDGKAGQFDVHRLKVGETLFRDFFPGDRGDEETK